MNKFHQTRKASCQKHHNFELVKRSKPLEGRQIFCKIITMQSIFPICRFRLDKVPVSRLNLTVKVLFAVGKPRSFASPAGVVPTAGNVNMLHYAKVSSSDGQ